MPKSLHIAHILISHNENEESFAERTKAEAKIAIDDALDRIKDGASFELVASNVSDCPSGAMGGILGEISEGEMVDEFEDIIFNLKRGAVSKVFETEYGYHLAWHYDPKKLEGVPESQDDNHGDGCGCGHAH